jgi:hypothetical protein
LPEETILNLGVNRVKPLLGASGFLSMRFNFGFELCYAILCRPQLLRKLSRRVDCVLAVLLGNISGFVQKLEDRLTGFVELRIVIVWAALNRTCNWNHRGAHC